MKYPKSLERLVESFCVLPGVGKKSALRMALFVYSNVSDEEASLFAKNILEVKKIKECPICGNLTEEDKCEICSDTTRNHAQIMVVEGVKDLVAIESLGVYKGIYHVLGGAIDFSNGVGVEDIKIPALIERTKNEKIDELILACNATLEGETTARYIKALLDNDSFKITRIAHGLPVGADISYADHTTVLKALEGRRNYE